MVDQGHGLPVVDTDILLRFALRDVPAHFERATEFFTRLELGYQRAQLTDTAVFETVFVMQKTYGVARHTIRELLLPVLQLATLIQPHRELYPDVFDLYVRQRKLSFADSFHAIFALRFGGGTVISFDRDFDRVDGIMRIEP